jgi:hypothetical protein
VRKREQKFAAESERLSRLLQNDRDRYNASLKEEQDRSALDRELLMKQIDQARQEKLAEITAMRQQLANREEREARQREQTEEAKAALRKAVSRARQGNLSCSGRRADRAPAGPTQDRQRGRPRQGLPWLLPKRGPAQSRKSGLPKPHGPAGRGDAGRSPGRAGHAEEKGLNFRCAPDCGSLAAAGQQQLDPQSDRGTEEHALTSFRAHGRVGGGFETFMETCCS